MTIVPLPHRGGTTSPIGSGWWQRCATLAQLCRLPVPPPEPHYASIRYWDRPTGRPHAGGKSPVLLVHGYAGTEHVWSPLRIALAAAGFDHLIALRYNAFRYDIHQVADWLVDRAQACMLATGADGIHLIGHSLGGLVIREAAGRPGLADRISTAVTIATPHDGAALARLVPGPAARQMRPGSDFLAELGERDAGGHTRWFAFHGTADRVVPSSRQYDRSGMLTIRTERAGHGSIARHPDVVARITSELIHSENTADRLFAVA